MTFTLTDLSDLPRLGFKGRGTMEAMARRGVMLEPQPNRTFRQADGGLCLVLGAGEVILLAPGHGDGAFIEALEKNWRIEDLDRSYPVPRRHGTCWFRITGRDAPAMFAKLCGVDLRPDRFENLAIAQTSVARLNGIVTRDDVDGQLSFHLLADIASTDYLRDCLEDAMAEFLAGATP